MSGAREQGKRAKCLAHLSGIVKGMIQYANDDSVEQIIPISMPHVNDNTKPGSNVYLAGGNWVLRTAAWFTWGGRSAIRPFKTGPASGFLCGGDPNLAGTKIDGVMVAGVYSQMDATRRPLNVYLFGDLGIGDTKAMEQFRCPSDSGYPDLDERIVDDSCRFNATRSCYDTIGSSYRGSLASYGTGGTGSQPATFAFAFGAWGHRYSSLQDCGRLVITGEPCFFNMIGVDNDSGALPPDAEVALYGWHKKKMIDNCGFADGSARSTKAESAIKVVDSADEASSDIHPDMYKLHRGANFRLDVYPVGGAIIYNRKLCTDFANGYLGGKWPGRNFQDNFRDIDTKTH